MFAVTLKRYLNPEIEIIEVDSDINSREFAGIVVDTLKAVFAALEENPHI